MNPLRFRHLLAAGRSPAHAKSLMDGIENAPTAPMERGSATHAIRLGTRRVIAYPGAVRRGKEWEAFQEKNQDALILTGAEYEKASCMAEAIDKTADAVRVLAGVHETPIQWRILSRDCYGTPDVRGDGFVTELKTCASADPFRFGNQAIRMSYHAQLAWYLDGVLASGLGKPSEAYVVAVESSAPFPVTVLRLTDRAIEKGRGLYHLWLETFLGCERAGQWPGYAQNIVDLDVPEDVELQFGDMEAA